MKRILATIILLCVLCSTLTSCNETQFIVKGVTDEYGNTYEYVAYRNEFDLDCYIETIYCYVSSDINNFKIVIPASLRDDSTGKDYPVVQLRGVPRAVGPKNGVSIYIDLQNEQIINTPVIIEVITNLDKNNISVSGVSTHALSDVNGELIKNVDFLFVKPGTNHEHTYELIYWDFYHYRSYTCGCIDLPAYLEHFGFDDDGLCDGCGYEHHHTKEEYRNEEGHGWNYTCGCETPDNFEKHSDTNNDGLCDGCGYTMPDSSGE